MNQSLFEVVAVNRDAVETNRGFYYQFLNVLKRWVQNYVDGKDVDVATEVEEDIKEVGDELVFTQLKCYSQNFSFNSKEVKKTIYNFFILYLKYYDTVPELRFAFETNSGISKNEKLLKKWVEQQPIADPELLLACSRRIETILTDEIKRRRNSNFAIIKRDGEKKKEINKAFNLLKSQLTSDHISRFISKVGWRFSDQSPEIAIHQILSEIRGLLHHEKFQNRPVDVFMDVLLSEIYYCSQNKDKHKRILQNARLCDLLQKTDAELEKYASQKVTNLFGTSLNKLHASVEQLQYEQAKQGAEIAVLKRQLTNDVSTLPKALTALPFISDQIAFGRQQFLFEIDNLLLQDKRLALYGVGGIGKTTMAKLYVHHYQEQYDHVIWINAAESVEESISLNEDLSFNLNLSFTTDQDIKSRFRTVYNLINGIPGNNLLVINNTN